MKNIFLTLIAILATLSINAQVVKVYENEILSASYTNSSTNAVKVVFEEAPPLGHAYVDLRLPSGTMWATCNVGADSPEKNGLLFAWGETTGRTSGTSSDHVFDWASYKWCNGSYESMTKYCASSTYGTVDNKTELEPSDDAATVNWGIGWRTPSIDQIDELLDSRFTTTTWTSQNGVYGRLITSIHNGNSIFLPAAGYGVGNGSDFTGTFGYYWSRSLFSACSCDAYTFYFCSDYIQSYYLGRYYGRSVRPVCQPDEKTQVVKVYENGELTATYINSSTNIVNVVFDDAAEPEPEPEPTVDNLLPGKFTVGDGKQVQFTNANLYWDGSDFKFEANQTDYPTEWDASHVGHFFWASAADYAYAETNYMASITATVPVTSLLDKFFADGSDADHMLTVEGTSGLYALSSIEWMQLYQHAAENNLIKGMVTVTNNGKTYENCLIIAPDDFTGELQSSYTLDEINAAGLLCLPAASYRDGSTLAVNNYGYYWAGVRAMNIDNYLECMYFNLDGKIDPMFAQPYLYGSSIRLVKDAEASEPTTKVTAITVMPSSLTLTAGVSATLMATVSPSDADNQTLSWTSSDESVATVVDGEVTAVAAGTATITCAATDGSGVTGTCVITVTSSDVPTVTGDNLLPGKFSVSATKKVQFTKSNLYWDGSDFRFEANQTDYPTEWSESHVGHFFWTSLADYQSGNASMPFDEELTYSNPSAGDKFWCGEDNPLTVEGTDGLYVLSGMLLSAPDQYNEWRYLMQERTNASNLCKLGVNVTNGDNIYTNCLIIAPDDFTGTLQSSYTLDEVNAAGLVCLPAAGYRDGQMVASGGDKLGLYWSSTPDEFDLQFANCLCFDRETLMSADFLDHGIFGYDGFRKIGHAIRLAKLAEVSEPSTEPETDPTPTGDNLLSGKFSVSATKQVQFTKGNLYWNGSAFKLEANQTDYPTEWSESHVGHFYWNSATDYQPGSDYCLPYAESYTCSSLSTSDKSWCGEENPLTIDGTSGLYTLTGGDSGEWIYLMHERTNASSLYKYGVTVTNGENVYENCLIIAPDNFTGELQSSYTLDEVNAAGLVCLPATGSRYGTTVTVDGSEGNYWSSTPDLNESFNGYGLNFTSDGVFTNFSIGRYFALSIRLVKDAEASEPEEETSQLVTAITVTPSTLSLPVGSTSILSAAVSPSNATNPYLRWSSSDESVVMVADSIVIAVGVGTATITCAATDGSGVTATCVVTVTSADTPADEPTPTGDNLLSGKFSVSETKQVQFTKGNLYWDGSDFKLEAHQMDYPTEWNESHVGHFFWTNLTDYQSGNASYMPYAEEFSFSSQSTSDKFWCGEENPLTVEGTSGLYALSSEELNYLLNERPNASSLYRYGAFKIDEEENYTLFLIIAPDDYTGKFEEDHIYTLDELNALDFVCLPGAGSRFDSDFFGGCGFYWTSTPNPESTDGAYGICFDPSFYVGSYGRAGFSIRLVKDAEASEPEEETSQLVTAITVTPSSLTLPVGSTSVLSAAVSPSNATKPYLRWSSSDESVVMVADTIVIAVGVGTATITCAATDGSGVTATCVVTVTSADTPADEPTPTDANLLSGKFSVSATKKVQFTKSNLYWDGSDFRFEANQTDYPTEWSESHVGHFYWATTAEDAYAEFNSESEGSTSDKLWCGEDSPLTVEGTSGLYALTGGDNDEWDYLINKRTNASNLYKYDVTVSNGEMVYGCLIIAPDDFKGELQSNYTLDEVNAAGLVCLPFAGYRKYVDFNNGGECGYYWTNTSDSDRTENAFALYCNMYYINANEFYGIREYGYSLRLVRSVE